MAATLLAHRDRRIGRRRQVDADRPAAVRQQGRHGGPAGRRRAHLQGARTRLHRPGSGDRRPARRARTGHHDRRRLPLLRHGQAEIHHRRHPGPHPVHPQHGHRHVDRAVGDRVGRRPPRPARAVPQARVPGVAAGHPAHRAGGQQDGPRRLGPRAVREDPRRLPRIRGSSRRPRRHHDPAVGAAAATTSSPSPTRRRGTTDRRCCRTSKTSTSPATATSSTCASRSST